METSLKAKAKMIREDGGYLIRTYWEATPELDRPNTHSIWMPTLSYAFRVIDCINAQKAYVNPRIEKDVNNQTYVEAECLILGRKVNSCLKELGF